MKCGQCRFWNAVQDERGECRFNPPQVVVITEKQKAQGLNASGLLTNGQDVIVNKIQPVFPPMMAESTGCGQFQQKDTGTMHG